MSAPAVAPSADATNSKMNDYAREFGISTVMGAATGVAARRLTSDALYGAGLCFVGLQCLQYVGFISINWVAINDAFVKKVDQNDDGKLDGKDLKIIGKRLMSFLARGLPDVAGFGTGFTLGFKYLA